jgi:hypothetical protein
MRRIFRSAKKKDLKDELEKQQMIFSQYNYLFLPEKSKTGKIIGEKKMSRQKFDTGTKRTVSIDFLFTDITTSI